MACLLVWWGQYGSGVVKVCSGDATWRDLTAMAYHLHTQPLPTRTARLLHRGLGPSQGGGRLVAARVSTLLALGVELALPLALLLLPASYTAARLACIVLLSLLQLSICATGHFGFFNVLSLLMGLTLLPDSLLAPPPHTPLAPPVSPSRPARLAGLAAATLPSGLLLYVSLAALSRTVTRYCPASRLPQLLRASPPSSGPVWSVCSLLGLGCHYGLFARMTTTRREVTVQLRTAALPQEDPQQRRWREVVFR